MKTMIVFAILGAFTLPVNPVLGNVFWIIASIAFIRLIDKPRRSA